MARKFFILFFLLEFVGFSQSWQQLSSGISGSTSVVSSMENFNGKLIAAGRFTSAGSVTVNNIAAWDGSIWSALGTGLSLVNQPGNVIKCLEVYNNELYAFGNFTAVGASSVCCIAKWDGFNWTSVADSIRSPGLIWDMAVYNGSLIVAGVFTTINGVGANYIASWNGSNWNPLANGITASVPYSTGNPFYNEEIMSLLVFNSRLYCAGTFSMIGSVSCNNIANWDGTSWYSVPGIIRTGYTHGFLKIQSYNGELYGTNGAFGLSKYDGSSAWNTIGTGLKFGLDMEIYNNKLIIGGSISTNVINVSNIIAYDGTNWSYIGGNSSSNGVDNWVYALKNYGSQLYTGGSFIQANGPVPTQLNRIGVYSGPISVIENEISQVVHVFPNPSYGKFYVKPNTDISSIKVNDVLGHSVFETTNPISLEYIDLEFLPAGLYFLEVRFGTDQNEVYKLIKE